MPFFDGSGDRSLTRMNPTKKIPSDLAEKRSVHA